MAVATPQTIASIDDCFLRPTEHCFYCGEPLTGEQWIYWNGNDERGQQIWLHSHCAKHLSDKLAKDFHDTR